MRRNNRTRPSSLTKNYDVIYRFIPKHPEISYIINHPRKLIVMNRCADPYNSRPKVVPYERTPRRCPVEKGGDDEQQNTRQAGRL